MSDLWYVSEDGQNLIVNTPKGEVLLPLFPEKPLSQLRDDGDLEWKIWDRAAARALLEGFEKVICGAWDGAPFPRDAEHRILSSVAFLHPDGRVLSCEGRKHYLPPEVCSMESYSYLRIVLYENREKFDSEMARFGIEFTEEQDALSYVFETLSS